MTKHNEMKKKMKMMNMKKKNKMMIMKKMKKDEKVQSISLSFSLKGHRDFDQRRPC